MCKYALHATEPHGGGYPEVRSVILCDSKRNRDTLVKYINEDQEKWAEFRRKYPYETIPSSFHWYPGSHAEVLTMREARKLIGDNEPTFVSDGWARGYAYVPCEVYERKVYDYER